MFTVSVKSGVINEKITTQSSRKAAFLRDYANEFNKKPIFSISFALLNPILRLTSLIHFYVVA